MTANVVHVHENGNYRNWVRSRNGRLKWKGENIKSAVLEEEGLRGGEEGNRVNNKNKNK